MIPRKIVQTGNAKVDACAYVLPRCYVKVFFERRSQGLLVPPLPRSRGKKKRDHEKKAVVVLCISHANYGGPVLKMNE